MKRLLALLLASVMALAVFAGCTADTNVDDQPDGTQTEAPSNEEPATTPSGDEGDAQEGSLCTVSEDSDIVVLNYADISTFFPANITQSTEYLLASFAYESLCDFNDDMSIKYVLATGSEVSEDGLEYTFTLREGVYFSDGAPWNAEACKANFDLVLDESNAFMNVWMLSGAIESCEVVDEYTIKLHLYAPYAPLLNVLAAYNGFVSPNLIEKGEDAWKNEVAGTGQYTLASYTSGESAVYELNRNYWGYDAEIAGENAIASDAGFNSITVRPVAEESTRIAMVLSGEADIINSVTATNIPNIEAGGATVIQQPGSMIGYLYFNCQKGALTDARVRKAIAMAIDVDSLINVVYGGANQPCDSVLVPSITSYKSMGRIEYDVEAAKALLAEAGYSDGLTLVAWEENDTTDIQRGEFIQQQLEQIGITLEIYPMESGILATRVGAFDGDPAEQEYDLYIRGYGTDTYDPDEMLGRYSTSAFTPAGSNYSFYSNPEYDALIEQGASATDQAERDEIYAQAQEILWEEMPVFPLHVNTWIAAHGSRIENLTYTSVGDFNFNGARFVG